LRGDITGWHVDEYYEHRVQLPVRIPNITLYGENGEKIHRGVNLWIITRTQLAIVYSRVGLTTHIELFSRPLLQIAECAVGGQELELHFKDGAHVYMQWIARGLPTAPRWLTALTVLAEDEPVNAKAIADMDAARRGWKADAETTFARVMERFAADLV